MVPSWCEDFTRTFYFPAHSSIISIALRPHVLMDFYYFPILSRCKSELLRRNPAFAGHCGPLRANTVLVLTVHGQLTRADKRASGDAASMRHVWLDDRRDAASTRPADWLRTRWFWPRSREQQNCCWHNDWWIQHRSTISIGYGGSSMIELLLIMRYRQV